MNLLTPDSLETDDGSGMIFFALPFIRAYDTVSNRGLVSKGLVKANDKIISEIIGYTAAITRCIPDDLIFGRDNLDIRSLIEGVNNDERLIGFGECQPEHGGAFRWDNLRNHVMIREVYLIIIRLGDLRLMRKPTRTFVLIENRTAGYRHDGKLSIVVHPWARLMGLLETTDFISRIGVEPAIAHPPGLWRPEVHAPWHGYYRVRITRGKFMP